MTLPKSTDVLATTEIRGHTQRVLALQKRERQARQKLGQIVAEIGAELIAVKEALDKTPDKTAWLRWLKEHVHYSAKTAERYMQVARFGTSFDNACAFFDLDPSVLYRLAALPDELVATLTPDTLLTDPRTGRQAPLREMTARELDRALDALEGKPTPDQPKPRSADVRLDGATREQYAADVLNAMDLLAGRLADIRGRKGRLTGESKQDVLGALERVRRAVLKWPAWATPDDDRPAR
jgi:hypothetical protein